MFDFLHEDIRVDPGPRRDFFWNVHTNLYLSIVGNAPPTYFWPSITWCTEILKLRHWLPLGHKDHRFWFTHVQEQTRATAVGQWTGRSSWLVVDRSWGAEVEAPSYTWNPKRWDRIWSFESIFGDSDTWFFPALVHFFCLNFEDRCPSGCSCLARPHLGTDTTVILRVFIVEET